MERTDTDQEGTTLPPISGTRLIARDEANNAILVHMNLCPFSRDNYPSRIRTLETNYARLVGFLIGAGVLGGAAGGAVAKLLTP